VAVVAVPETEVAEVLAGPDPDAEHPQVAASTVPVRTEPASAETFTINLISMVKLHKTPDACSDGAGVRPVVATFVHPVRQVGQPHHFYPTFGKVGLVDIDEAAVRRWRKARLEAGRRRNARSGP
jgi:hypothetical protein